METVIKVNPSELNELLLDKIKSFIGNKNNIDVTISLKEFDPDYADALDRSISQAETGNVITMTMEEFVAYASKNELQEPQGQYQPNAPSIFVQIIDSLRNKSEAELKMLYLRMFQNDLVDEWATLTKDIDFSNVSDEEIVSAIQKNRYRD